MPGAALVDIIAAAQQIKSGATSLAQKTSATASTLGTQGQRLAAVSHPSRTGANAARAVDTASKALGECAAALNELSRAVDTFVTDASN
jgi:hypothetical protein